MWVNRWVWAVMLAAIVMVGVGTTANAHQPYFEETDYEPAAPYRVADPTISTAIYGTLQTAADVDYVAFTATAGQSILFGMSIPAIEGQAEFNPTIAVIGPGLPTADLPSQIEVPADHGAVVLRDGRKEAAIFLEPFSMTRYWERQEEYVTLPAGGDYMAVVWHEGGALGRYTFVIGNREILGGDPQFRTKMRSYWTPYLPDGDGSRVGESDHTHDSGHAHRDGFALQNILDHLIAMLFGRSAK